MMTNNFKISEVTKFWDNIAEEYDRINKNIGQAHYQRFTESIKYLNIKNGDRLLNIWSRTGNALPYLKKIANLDIDNLEASPIMIKIAKNKFPQDKFYTTDLTNLDYSDNYFDAILSLETLEHSPQPQKLLNEFYRVLKPGKFLVMSLPPATAELPLRIYEIFFENHGEGPHKFLSSKKVKKMIKNSGFQLILHKGTLLIPAGPKYIQKIGEKIIEKLQKTPIKELGIRQFYVCKKI